ncbi:MAG TPA: SDR family oxidoreductase [Candidatus Limnocylindrales bacterium]
MGRLDGRTVLVTGSTGIGGASAELFAGEGAAVFVTSRTEAHCRELCERIEAAGGRVAYQPAELGDADQVEAVVASCRARFGRVDGLFAVAGGSGRRFGDGPLHTLSGAAWDGTLALNARTQALTAGAVLRSMLGRSANVDGTRGSIVLMSSVLATDPVPELFATHAYAAAKGAIAALTITAAAFYAPHGIRVNAVAPALVATPMADRAMSDPATLEFARRKQPLAGGILDPLDVARAALFLLSDESRFITGQLLKVDAGWSVVKAGLGDGDTGASAR